MDALALRQLDRVIWAIVAVVAIAVLAAPAMGHFTVAWRTLVPPALGSAGFVLAAAFYRHWRPDPRLESGLQATAQLIAFTAVGGPLSYVAASGGLSLHDHTLDVIDHALGLDWRGLLAWMNSHPVMHFVFALLYSSFPVQATVTIMALAISDRFVQLRTFLLAFMLSAIICIAISSILPAEGVWGFYKLTAIDYPAIVPSTREAHLPIFHGLRDGSMRELTGMSEGIITFPSFHAALGIVFITGLWPVPVLRWLGLVANVLMIIATPVDGGHYFVDVLAGITIAALSYLAARRIVRAVSAAAAWQERDRLASTADVSAS